MNKQIEGLCPECGETLNYKDWYSFVGGKGYYEVECNCGWLGNERYDIKFTGHDQYYIDSRTDSLFKDDKKEVPNEK